MVKLQNQNPPKNIQTNLAPNNCLVREFVRKKAYRFVAIKNCQVVVSEESGVTDENLRGAKVKKSDPHADNKRYNLRGSRQSAFL